MWNDADVSDLTSLVESNALGRWVTLQVSQEQKHWMRQDQQTSGRFLIDRSSQTFRGKNRGRSDSKFLVYKSSTASVVAGDCFTTSLNLITLSSVSNMGGRLQLGEE